MKKLILSLALAAASVTAFAQSTCVNCCPSTPPGASPGVPTQPIFLPPVAVQLPSGFVPGQPLPPIAVQLPVFPPAAPGSPPVAVQLPINIFVPGQLPWSPPVYITQLPININYPAQLPSGPGLPVDAQVVTVQPGKVVVVRGTTSK